MVSKKKNVTIVGYTCTYMMMIRVCIEIST
jgi:hypothetical protein